MSLLPEIWACNPYWLAQDHSCYTGAGQNLKKLNNIHSPQVSRVTWSIIIIIIIIAPPSEIVSLCTRPHKKILGKDKRGGATVSFVVMWQASLTWKAWRDRHHVGHPLHRDWLRDTCHLHQDTWLTCNEGGGTPTPYFLLYFSQHPLRIPKWVPPPLTTQIWSALSSECGSTFPTFLTLLLRWLVS